MERNLTSNLKTQVQAAVLRPVVFYKGEFSTGTLRLWSGGHSVTWDSQSWTGAGNLLGISDIRETTEVRATGVTVSLVANSSIVAIALAQARTGKAGLVWIGALDSAGAIIADPYLAFEGRLDVPDIAISGDTCVVTISYEHRLIALERANESRITDQEQQREFPGDLGRQYVAGLQDAVIVW